MNTETPVFKTIVVATDLCEPGSLALRYAQGMARRHEATLVILHVIDPVAYAFPGGAPEAILAVEAARKELLRIEEETRREGIAVVSVVESGVVCDRILQALTDRHADLLVLGTRARTAVGRAALGTIARRLLAKAPCPVLTIAPDNVGSLANAGHWRHVLAATDFSTASVVALHAGHQMAERLFTVLHVKSCSASTACSNCMERMRYLAPFNEAHTVPVEHVVFSGKPGEMIPRYAQALRADLVVLGVPGGELSEGDFASSTVLQTIATVRCPVLCIPSGYQAAEVRHTLEDIAVAC